MIGRRIAAEHLQEGRGEIDGLDQLVADRPARRVRRGRGVVDDQRHLDGRLVEQVLLAHPMVAQVVPVIGGEDDQGVLEETALPHEPRR